MTFTAYTNNETTKQCLEEFLRFDLDTQLALLWYGYKDIKDQLSPGSETFDQEISESLFHLIQALPQEEQLQAQRDIVAVADTQITRTYKAMSSSGKLFLWLRLAQGMEDGSIITVPDDYQLPSETQGFVEKVKSLDFEERINFMRSVVDTER